MTEVTCAEIISVLLTLSFSFAFSVNLSIRKEPDC